MAEAFFNKMSDGSYRALSAGTQPSERPHREVVLAMHEIGMDISETPGTLLTQDLVDQAELVIGMGCNVADACPALHTPLQDWDLDDPKGRSAEEVSVIRDLIELKVRNLLGKLSHPS
jgi:arsenate reductase (thioredoxin)